MNSKLKVDPEMKLINTFSNPVGVELPLSTIGLFRFKLELERRRQSSVFSGSLFYQ